MAYEKGTTALGTLSFALGQGSTAVGLRAFADFDATGSTAIGEEARTFAANTISIGNKTEATRTGSLAFGNTSRAVGEGSIAIGDTVASNALLSDAKFNILKQKIEEAAKTSKTDYKTGDNNSLVAAGFKAQQGDKKVSKLIKQITTAVNRFEYKEEDEVVITTSSDVKKTQQQGDHAISLGYYLLNNGDNTVALGTASRIHGSNSVAIGALNTISDQAHNAIAIGVGTRVEKENSIALGTGSLAKGAGSLVLGAGALGSADNTMVLGYGASSTNRNSLAIGNESEATLENSTALGYKSKTDYKAEYLAEPGYVPRGAYSIPTSGNVGVISVGSRGSERRIVNVASGYKDTDAVNVAQLRSLEDRIDFDIHEDNSQTINYFSVNSGGTESAELKNLVRRESQYKEYLKLKKLEATLEIRKKAGETIKPEKTAHITNRINELENANNPNAAVLKREANALLDLIAKVQAGDNSLKENGQFKPDKAFEKLEEAEATASANSKNIVSTAEKNRFAGTNYDNTGAEAKDSIAIGYKSQVKPGAIGSIAIGRKSVVQDNKTSSVAIGDGAEANESTAVALGSSSVASVGNNVQGYDPLTNAISNQNNSTWKSTHGAVSIGDRNGNNKVTRQITGVAAGTDDTDAVNVAQLKKVRDAAVIKYFSVRSSIADNQNNNGAVHNDTIAIGPKAKAEGHNSVAIGHEATTANTTSVALGYKAKVEGDYGVGLGSGITFTKDGALKPDYSVAVGSNITLGKDAKNSIAIGRTVNVSNVGSVVIGENTNSTGDNGVVLGRGSNVSVEHGVALGSYSVANREKDQYGYDILTEANSTSNDKAWKSTRGAVSVGETGADGSVKHTRQIINVAAGTKDTDAVNVAQLKKIAINYRSQNTGETSPTSKSATIKQGLLFKSTNDALKIKAKENGEIEFGLTMPTTTDNNTLTFKAENASPTFERKNSESKTVEIKSAAGTFTAGGTGSSAGILYSGANLSTRLQKTAEGAKIEIGFKDQPEFTKITIKNTTGTLGPVLSTSGIAMNNNKITGLGKGSDSTDAARYDQLTGLEGVQGSTIKDKIEKGDLKAANGLELTGTGTGRLVGSGDLTVKLSDTIKAKIDKIDTLPTTVADGTKYISFEASNDGTTFTRTNNENKTLKVTEGAIGTNYVGDNLKTAITSTGTLTIGLKKAVAFDSVSVNNGDVALNSNGIQLNNKAITGVADIPDASLGNGTTAGDSNSDSNAVNFKMLKNLSGVQDSTVTSKVQKGNLVAEDGIEFKEGKNGNNRLIGADELKIGLDTATKTTLAKVGTGVISSTDTAKDKTVTGEAVQTALDNLKIKYNAGGKNGVTGNAQETKLTEGLKFISKNDNLSIEAKANGEIEFTVADGANKNLSDIDDDGKKVIREEATKAVLVKVDDSQKENPITIKEEDDNTNKTKTYKIGLNLTNLTTKFGESFAKVDASNITEANDKSAWRTALNVYDKTEVYNKSETDTKVKAATEKVVVSGGLLTVSDAAGENGLGKTYTVGLDADKVKDAAGTKTLGNLAVDNELKLTGDGTNKLLGGNVTVGLSDATKTTLAKVGAGVIDSNHADKDKTVTGKTVYDYVNPIAMAALSFAADKGTTFTRANNEARTVNIKSTTDAITGVGGAADTEKYLGTNLTTKIVTAANGESADILIGLKENPNFKSVYATDKIAIGDATTSGPALTKDGIDGGNKVISNVAKGVNEQDVITVDQLKPLIAKLGGTLKDSGDDKGTVELPDIKLKTGATATDPNGKKIYDTVGKALEALDEKLSQTATGSNSITFTDGATEENKHFKRANNEDKTVTITKKDNDKNVTVELTKDASGKIGTFKIGFAEKPTFKGITLDPTGDGSKTITITPSDDGNKVTFAKPKNGADGKDGRVVIDGVKDGDTPDSVVTKETFDKIVGKDGKDGIDGRNGINGFDGNKVKDNDNLVGPAGKDGLNGTSVNEKANALRRGEAGPVVFTTEDGTRIAKAKDGKLFKKENVTTAGDLKADGYVKVVGEDGTPKYYKVEQLDENGLVKAGEQELQTGDELEKAKAEIAKVEGKPVEPANVVHSLVNIDGATTNPSTLSNVASGINPKEIGKEDKAIKVEDATKLIGGDPNVATDKGLLGLADKSKLNTVATVGDLQAVAKAGLNFKGNVATGANNATTHRALTETLEIVGNSTATAFTDYSTDNVATKVSEGKIEIGFKKAPKFDSLIVGTNTDNTKNVNINNNGIDLKDKSISGLNKGKADNEAVNVEQLNPLATALGTKVDENTGVVAAPSFTIVNKDAKGGADGKYNTVGGALTALDTAITNQKIKYQDGGTGAAKEVALSTGLKFTSANDKLTVAAKENGEISFTVNLPKNIPNTVADGTKTLTVKASILEDGLKPNGYVKTNNEDRAITVIEGDIEDKTAAGGTAVNYKGTNLKTSLAADGTIKVGFKEAPTFKELTVNDSATIAGMTFSSTGLAMANKKITGLAKGTDNADAVNKEQLEGLATKLGGGATVAADGSITAPTYKLMAGEKQPTKEEIAAGTTTPKTKDYNTVETALKALDNAIENVKNAEFSEGGAEKIKNLARDAVKVTAKAGTDNAIVVNPIKTGDKNTTYELFVEKTDTIDTKAGTPKDPAPTQPDEAPNHPNRLVTEKAVVEFVKPISTASLSFAADGGNIFTRGNSETKTVNIKSTTDAITGVGGAADTEKYLGTNLTTKIVANTNGADIFIGMKENPNFTNVYATEKIAIGTPAKTGPALTKDGIDGGNLAIANVGKGVNEQDAITVEQLKPILDRLGATLKTDGTAEQKGTVTAPTYDLKTGAEQGKPTKAYTTVGDALKALDEKLVTTAAGNNSITFTDGAANNNFVRANNENKTIEITKADNEANITVALTKDAAEEKGTFKVGLNKDITKIDSITTNETANKEKSVLNQKGFTASVGSTAGTDNDRKTKVTADGVEVLNNQDKSKLTAQGLEMTDKNGSNSDKKNVLNKTSITLSDTAAGVNNTNTITAAKSEIKDKDNNIATVTASEISVANGTEKVSITKNSVTGAGKLGKDDNNALIFNPATTTGTTNTPANAVLKVDNTDLTLTKATDGKNGATGISLTGLTERDVTSTKYGVDENKTRAATEGAVKHLSDVLGATNTITNKTGPAGKDGLDGKTVLEKIEGLRDGQSGALVYTDASGKRLVKDPATGKYYVMKDDGSKDENQEVQAENVRLSAVDPTGETTKPITIGNLASALGLDGKKADMTAYGKPIADGDAKTVIEGLLKKGDDLNRAVTLADLQALAVAGLDFTGNTTLDGASNVTNHTTHRKLSQKLTIIGKENVTSFNDYSTDNLATRVSEGKIEIGMLKTPRFDALELGAKPTGTGTPDKKITLTPDADKGKITLAKSTDPAQPNTTPEDNKVVLDGLKAGTTSDSAVTKGQLDALASQTGNSGNDGEDGRNGSKGLDGTDVATKDAGPAGKDGLNGKDLNEKANALRRGEAGTVVYTDKDGNRLVKGLDGKLYKADDLKNKVYIAGTGYVDKDKTEEKDGAYTLKAGEQADPVKEFDRGTNNENVRLSAVNIDGTTNTPTTLANVASGINPEKIGKNAQAILADEAKKLIAGDPDATNDEAAKKGLLGLTDKSKLNTVATVGDLQALAQAGMDFGANNGADIHRTLGSRISIVGNKAEFEKIAKMTEDEKTAALEKYLAKFSDKNIITTADADKNEISIKLADRPEFKGIDVVDEKDPNKTTQINPNGTIVMDKSGKNIKVSVTNPDGMTATVLTKGKNGEPKLDDNKKPVVEKAATYNADGMRVVDVIGDGKFAEVKPNKVALGNDKGETAILKGADGTNGATLELKDKNGADGLKLDGEKKSITGLADLTDTSDGSSAVNKNYVDKVTKAAATEVDQGKNIVVTENRGANGQTIYNVSVVEKPEFKGVDVVDPAKPEEKVSIAPTGTTVIGKDGEKIVKTVTGKDGVKITKSDKEDGTNNDGTPTNESATYGLGGTTIHKGNDRVEITPNEIKVTNTNPDNPKDINTTSITKNKISIQKADGEDTVTIKGADGINGATLELKGKDGADGLKLDGEKKSITGLADLTDGADGSSAVNKSYVDSKLDGLGANKPFEYRDAADPTKVVVNGKDGKLYRDEDIKDKVFVEGTGYVSKDDAKKEPSGKWTLKDTVDAATVTKVDPIPSDKVVITAMPQGDTPLSVGNVASGLNPKVIGVADDQNIGKAKVVDTGTAKKLIAGDPDAQNDEAAKKGLLGVDDKAKLNTVATVGDLQAVAKAGLTFVANKDAGEVHRTLGNSLTIKGQGTDDKKDFEGAAGNIKVVVPKDSSDTLEIQLSDKLENMKSATFVDKKEVEVDGKKVITTTTNVVNGKGSTITEEVEVDGKKETTTTVSVTKDGINAGGKKVTNVGEGNIAEGSTDAVTGGQVHNIVNGMSERIQNNSHRIDKIEKTVGQGLANSAAMSTIEFMDIGINQYTVGAAVGTYKGTQAVAVGVQAAPTESMRVHAKMSVTPSAHNNVMAGVGASWRFNFK